MIQLVPSAQPGRFFAWVVADGIMQKVPIDVPRVFYINTKAPVTEEFPGRCVKKILPHSRPTFNLVEVLLVLLWAFSFFRLITRRFLVCLNLIIICHVLYRLLLMKISLGLKERNWQLT